MATIAGAGGVIAIAAVATGAAWYSPVVLIGAVTGGFGVAILMHMHRRPMLAIIDGNLVCRLAGAGQASANLTREWRFPLGSIERVEREIRPWPKGERHVYWVHLHDGRVHELVPRPADAATRAAMATLFDGHLAGRVQERRV